MKAGDTFWFERNEWKIISLDLRESRSCVAIDRGCDASGNERRVAAVRICDGFRRRLSFQEIGTVCHSCALALPPSATRRYCAVATCGALLCEQCIVWDGARPLCVEHQPKEKTNA